MASFFITTTACDTPGYPWAHANFLRVTRAAERSAVGHHVLANHPDDADVVLFVEPGRRFQTDVTRSAMYRTYRNKALVIDFSDNPFPRLPGLYANLTRKYAANSCYQSGFYIRVADNMLFQKYEYMREPPDLLYSFVGRAANCPAVREEVLQLSHPRALLRNASSNQADSDSNYVALLYRSKFVLAPRGYGVSTWRLFETMRAGRVPVIISDDWVEPGGICWPEFSLRVPEQQIGSIPAMLESLEKHAPAMGIRARTEWERCFSAQHCFDWIASRSMETLAAFHQTRRRSSTLSFMLNIIRTHNSVSYLREQLAAVVQANR